MGLSSSFKARQPLLVPKTVGRQRATKTAVSLSLDDAYVFLYDSQLTVASVIENQLSAPSLGTIAVLYGTGLLSAFSPCEISLLPLTLAYLGGAIEDEGDTSERIVKVVAYSTGMAASLTATGMLASYLGSTTSDVFFSGTIRSALAATLVLLMGFNLLGIISIQFPSLNKGAIKGLAEPFRSTFFGASSALVSSPCASPILASILAFISSTSINPAVASLMLLSYSFGFTTPVVAACSGIGGVSLIRPQDSSWSTRLFGAAFVFYGVYSVLEVFFSL